MEACSYRYLRNRSLGFRAAKGTKHARTSYSNLTDTNLNLLFLDWKQAFDSVDHPPLRLHCSVFGIPADIQAPIQSTRTQPSRLKVSTVN